MAGKNPLWVVYAINNGQRNPLVGVYDNEADARSHMTRSTRMTRVAVGETRDPFAWLHQDTNA